MFYKESGQTILEVLVALTLVIFFLLGVLTIEIFALRNLEYAQNKSMASRLARQQLERAKMVRDTTGIDGLSVCLLPCYINGELTPVPLTPTGIYGQSLSIAPASVTDCLLPDVTITPPLTSYKATANVSWGGGVVVTPPPEVEIFTCLTEWR